MEQITWLVLAHQVPVTPSKKRVYVWRKLKEMGATYFRQGVAMLPKTPNNMIRFQLLADKVEDMGGEATIAELRFLNPRDEQNAIAEFREQSHQEYKKILKEINKLNSDIISGKKDPQEGSEKSKRLEKRLEQILSRDYFMFRREPEVTDVFNELLKDMSEATNNLSKHFRKIVQDK